MTRDEIVRLAARNQTCTINRTRQLMGLSCVTGIPQRVRATQGYTTEFAAAVIDEYASNRDSALHLNRGQLLVNQTIEMAPNPVFADLWEDLDLRTLALRLGLPFDRLIV